MLILAILGLGMIIGAIAQMILVRDRRGIDWPMALVAGIGGSFVGGLLASLIAGDGIRMRPSGIIGSIIGALITTGIWLAVRNKSAAKAEAAAAAAAPRDYNKGHQHSGTSKNKKRRK